MIVVRNPATGEAEGQLPSTPPEEIPRVVERARAAQAEWAALPLRERIRRVRRLGEVIYRRREEILRTIMAEVGSAEVEALFQVIISLAFIRYWCREAPRQIGVRRARVPLYLGPKTARVLWQPLGVVGCIGTWNFPWIWPGVDAVPAMIAGNAVIFKPSEYAPRCGLLYAEVCREAGLPEHLYQVVLGHGDVGAALVEAVDMVTFTGSRAVGRRVAEAAARRMIPFLLELGGKDPMIVLRDADLERAARAAVFGGLLFSGQACISVERVYVEEPVYDRFLARLVELVGRVRVGTGPGCDMGPLVTPAQLRKVEEQVRDAVAKGARVLCGGRRLEELGPLYYAPTVLADVTPEMLVMREETFGPVIAVRKVRDAAEALREANRGEYGLAASVFGGNLRRAWELAARVEAGTTAVGDVLTHFAIPDLPFGGVKGSSYGYRNGPEFIRRFTRPHAIVAERVPVSHWFIRFPFDAVKGRLFRLILRLWFAPGRRKVTG